MTKHEEEVRCNEETAYAMLNDNVRPVEPIPTFQAALGIPLVVRDDIPMGVVQFWRDGEMIKEIVL